MNYNEQVSLLSRLLETIIRYTLKNKHKENGIRDKQSIYKEGSELKIRDRRKRIVFVFTGSLTEVIKTTVIKWGRATNITDPNLIREMFKLIYNQYDGIGEVKTS